MKARLSRNNLSRVLMVLVALVIGGTGVAYMNRSSAAMTFQPLEAGTNFQAGWQTAQHTDAENKIIIDKMSAAGLKWVRIDIGWGTIEENADTFGGDTDPTATYTGTSVNQWYVKKIDTAVNYARSKGLRYGMQTRGG